MAIKNWHYGKLLVLWGWGALVSGFCLHSLETIAHWAVGYLVIIIMLGLPIIMSVVTWKWLSGQESRPSVATAESDRLKASDLLDEVAAVVADALPSACEHAGKISHTFSFIEDGKRLGYRPYVSVCLDEAQPKQVILIFHRRAVRAVRPLLDSFRSARPDCVRESDATRNLEVAITAENWDAISRTLQPVLCSLVDVASASPQELSARG